MNCCSPGVRVALNSSKMTSTCHSLSVALRRAAAFAKALEEMPFPLGVLYESDARKSFEETLPAYREDRSPLRERSRDAELVRQAILEKR